jgi:NAD(P)-dependent dehydrogenase (short-subunit alcohol dehydrogenase family)
VSAARSIFITGAGGGIGAATARLFAARGWHVGLSDVNPGALESLARELGPTAGAYLADVRDPAALEAALAGFAASGGGRLDAVFANAGVLFMGPDRSITPAQKDLLVDVNVRGVVHTIDAAFPFLARTPGARIVAMCSTSAEYGSPRHAVYSATKFFVRGLTEALDIEYREHGIRVAAIYAPYVQTAMVLDAPVKPATIARLGVRIAPERVAETVWRAVHGRRVHWRVGLDARLINLAVRLLGGAVAPLYARLARD